jgi:Cu(I)/Ag(I) efflux system membrane fusion protein
MALMPGMTLARINGLGTMWLEVAVPEVHAALLSPGRPVRATMAAYPGETFDGRVAVVLPEAARETRTLRVRIELPNRAGKLKAGMYAQATIGGQREEALVVPSEAVIRTGQRAVVFVAGEQTGRFSPVDVELGREVGGRLIVLKGLSAGQQVVASGQFLIDSEASMSGMVGRSATGAASAASASAAAAVVHEATGVVEAIEPNRVTLQHDPVPALKWPAMSMPFALKATEQTAGLKVGDRVRFSFSEGASGVVIERIARQAPAPAGKATDKGIGQ